MEQTTLIWVVLVVVIFIEGLLVGRVFLTKGDSAAQTEIPTLPPGETGGTEH